MKPLSKKKLRLHQTAIDAGIATEDWYPVVIHGNAIDRIREQEEEQGADLIILGKHGFGEKNFPNLGIGVGVAEEFILGSNTRQVLIHARCDVLVAPYRKASSTTSKLNPAQCRVFYVHLNVRFWHKADIQLITELR